MKRANRILIADRDPSNRRRLEGFLASEYELATASTCEECLEVASQFRPDAVLLDLDIPGVDQYETCRRLRERECLFHTKIIILSERGVLSERLAGYSAGADDYLGRPVDRAELLSKLRVYMRLKTVEESNQIARGLNAELEQANRDLSAVNERLENEVSRRRRAEDQLRHDALHDVLTNLPNRALLADRINHCIRRMRREPDYAFAIMFLDVDDFKVVNDSLGHRVGDLFLIEVSKRLARCIRETDCGSRLGRGTTARLGGDDFIILLDGIHDEADTAIVAERIRAALAAPVQIGDQSVRPTASVGIAIGHSNYAEADEVIRDADTALYHAKRFGKDQTAVFAPQMRDRVVARLQMGNDLALALDREQIYLHYQPIVSLDTGEIEGFEALARWEHPEYGSVPPSEFIHIAEQTGLIVQLGQWVLRTACLQLAHWREEFPERPDLSVSVNVSGKQLSDSRVIADIDRIVNETGLDRRYLNLELTETVLIQNASPEEGTLEELTKTLRLHMDDFGTGYSSLSYLARLPIAALKLDRSFIEDALSHEGAATIKAVLDMAHARGLQVIAEGVEQAEQAETLAAMGCDMAQGYYFLRPVSPQVVEQLLVADGTQKKSA